MGWVRTLLALVVVATHAGVSFGVGGILAVQLFYMISGFLMSYILVEKRSYARVQDFYLSRYLRLFPAYIAVALTVIVAQAIGQPSWYGKFAAMPADALALLGFSNAFIFLQDVVMFTAIQDNRLVFATDFLKSDPPLFTGLLVPQAWTLSLELMFYMIAPFVLKDRRLIFALLAASLALRAWLISIGIGLQDPWSYRFFPTELALFLLGALSHQLALPLVTGLASRTALTVVAATLAGIVGWAFLPIRDGWMLIPLFLAFAAALPFLFTFQNSSRLDQWIGDLSYPIYISHMLTLNLCKFAFTKLGLVGTTLAAICSIALAVIVAYLLDRIVSRPVDRWRHKLRST